MYIKTTLIFVILGLLLLNTGCVSRKKFSNELRLRRECETKEMVTSQELEKRRKESKEAQDQVAKLNRSVGNLEKENRDLSEENKKLNARIQETTGSAVSRQQELSTELLMRDSTILQQGGFISQLKGIAKDRKGIMNGLFIEINNQLPGFSPVLELKDESMTLSIADSLIFDKTGTKITPNGLKQLAEIADFINSHPALNVVIEAHTDNSIPKSDLIRDSWDWSLIRAMAIVKAFAKELNVTTNQITAAGKGEFYPVASNETKEGRDANRRTVLVFTTKLPEVYDLLNK